MIIFMKMLHEKVIKMLIKFFITYLCEKSHSSVQQLNGHWLGLKIYISGSSSCSNIIESKIYELLSKSRNKYHIENVNYFYYY